MDIFKIIFICNTIVRAVAFISITVAAVLLQRVGILWFYLVPALLMDISYERKTGGK